MGCLGSKDDNSNANFNHLFKLVLVGEGGVGKSSLVLRYVDDTFLEEDVGTIGADFKIKFLNIGKTRLKLQIWDTAGQEKFRVMTSSYFAGASAVVVVFDKTNRESFNNIEKWIKEARSFMDPQVSRNLAFLIVGNKCDLTEEAVVTAQEAKTLADRQNALYFETSAKFGTGVSAAFKALAEKLRDETEPFA